MANYTGSPTITSVVEIATKSGKLLGKRIEGYFPTLNGYSGIAAAAFGLTQIQRFQLLNTITVTNTTNKVCNPQITGGGTAIVFATEAQSSGANSVEDTPVYFIVEGI
jgi:hypothetical protein